MLKDHYDSDFTDEGNFIATIGTRDSILKQRQNLHSNPKIARLRIGHTSITHSHCMLRGRPTECSLTGASPPNDGSFLFECLKTLSLRNQLKLSNDHREILGEQWHVPCLILYLPKIGILDEI